MTSVSRSRSKAHFVWLCHYRRAAPTNKQEPHLHRPSLCLCRHHMRTTVDRNNILDRKQHPVCKIRPVTLSRPRFRSDAHHHTSSTEDQPREIFFLCLPTRTHKELGNPAVYTFECEKQIKIKGMKKERKTSAHYGSFCGCIYLYYSIER